MINQSIHTIDLLYYLAGEVESLSKSSWLFTAPPYPVANLCTCRLNARRFESLSGIDTYPAIPLHRNKDSDRCITGLL
ncbi:hypothetical protein ACFL2E_01050 [Thermodesulfobacteriota bacterium]